MVSALEQFKIQEIKDTRVYKIPHTGKPGRHRFHVEIGDEAIDLELLRPLSEEEFISVSSERIAESLGLLEVKSLDSIAEDLSGFYNLHKWVFHEDVVKKVVEGDYAAIRPVSAEIFPTLNCTYRCSGCSHKQPKITLDVWSGNDFEDGRIHMQDFATMELILARLGEAGVKSVVFAGGGEPTLSQHTIPGIELANNSNLDTILYTNGSVLTSEDIGRIVRADPFGVRISLNAGSEDLHSRFHGYRSEQGFFGNVVRNIEAFAGHHHREGKPGDFAVAVLINRKNYRHLLETATLLADIVEDGQHRIGYVVYRPEINWLDVNDQLGAEVIRTAADSLEAEVRPVLESAGIRFYGLPEFFDSMLAGEKPYDKCLGRYTVAEVGPDGSVYVCTPYNCRPEYNLGNLNDVSHGEIMLGEKVSDSIDIGGCPVVCKPNELSKIFYLIEEKRGTSEWGEVVAWVQDLQKLPEPSGVNFIC